MLKEKAKYLKKSELEVLEWVIFEFSPSTMEERKIQKERKLKAEIKYLKEHTNRLFDDIQSAWRNGWKMGWLHFQIRKSTHPFKLEE